MPIIGAWPKYDPLDIQANCQALAVAFVEVLKRLDIDAKVREVRKYVRGRRFVVKLKRFADPVNRPERKTRFWEGLAAARV